MYITVSISPKTMNLLISIGLVLGAAAYGYHLRKKAKHDAEEGRKNSKEGEDDEGAQGA